MQAYQRIILGFLTNKFKLLLNKNARKNQVIVQ